MSFPFFKKAKRKVKDTAFGSTKETAQGVQQTEMADARMGILYFLGNTQAVPTLKFDPGLGANFIGDTTGFQDLAKASLWLVKKVPGVQSGLDVRSKIAHRERRTRHRRGLLRMAPPVRGTR